MSVRSWSFSGVVMCGALLLGSACSSSDKSADGSIPFAVKDQIFYGGSGDYELKILDYAGACAIQQASDSHVAGSQYIELDYSGSDAPGPGTYQVPSQINVELHVRDASCDNTVDVKATSGTLTITSETSSAVQGSFTADIPGYGTVSGVIDAAFCDTGTTTGAYACVSP